MMNIKSANELLELYQSITIEHIKQVYDMLTSQSNKHIFGHDVLEQLTGFGSYDSCKLCTEAKLISNSKDPRVFCKHCIYADSHYDDFYCIDVTYTAICDADTPEEIYEALQDRLNYLKQTLENYNGKSNENNQRIERFDL